MTGTVDLRSMLANFGLNEVAIHCLIAGGRLTRLGVGRLYNSDFASIPLTTVIRLRARVNPVGTEIVCVVHWARCVVWRLPCVSRDETVGAESARIAQRRGHVNVSQ